jgi:hypothetical protein
MKGLMIVASLLLLATTVAHTQVINGSGNGNNIAD